MKPAHTPKPKLSFWDLWNMSFGFLGIQFGFGLQNANVSRIFETLGAAKDDIPILWLAAPVTGLLVQPIVGYLSDRTWSPRWGRRRPFFLIGAILASIALILMPNSPALWFAAGMLWILDASINISMEPFRALVADKLPSEQRTTGFAVQTFFIGIGAVVASALPYMMTNWFGVANTAAPGEVPQSVVLSFYIGAFVFFATILWTVLRTREYPPVDMEVFEREKRESAGFLKGFANIFKSMVGMPKTMMQLAVVQYFTWFALFCMWIYTTSAVTSHVYGASDTTGILYNEGADWVGILMAMYNGVAAPAAFILPALASKIGRRAVHMISLIIGGISLASIYYIQSPMMLLLPFVGIGIAWASTLTMPYAILAGSLPEDKMGVYMGIFNFFIVIPQITAATILGFMMRNYFGNEAIWVLVLGGASMAIAGLMVLLVDDVDDVVAQS